MDPCLLSIDVYLVFILIPLFNIPHSNFGNVIIQFLRTWMYEMDSVCNLFSLLDPWGKCGSFGVSLGVCPTEPARCSSLSRCLVSVEDKRLHKCVILGGSTTHMDVSTEYMEK